MLNELLSKAVAADPGKLAIVQGPRRIPSGELAELVALAAGGLRHLGVQAGDCVATALPNGPEFVAALFACARLRAVLLPLNPQETSTVAHASGSSRTTQRQRRGTASQQGGSHATPSAASHRLHPR